MMQKHSSGSNLTVYRPSMKRVYCETILSLLIAGPAILLALVGFSMLINYGDLIPHFFIGFLGATVGTIGVARLKKTRLSISLSDVAISGPGFMTSKKAGFKLADIDHEKSVNRSFLEKLFGLQIIYSSSGDRIAFYRRQFNKLDSGEILRRCSLPVS